MSDTIQTFIANLRRAVHDRETATIGGGFFNCAELAEVLVVLEAAPQAPAAPAVDAETLRDAEHYRFIKRHRLILSGGGQKFGWPIAPFGDGCDCYIAQELAAERAAQAKKGGA